MLHFAYSVLASYYVMSVSAVFDVSVFNLSLFWWRQCEIISDRLFKRFMQNVTSVIIRKKSVNKCLHGTLST